MAEAFDFEDEYEYNDDHDNDTASEAIMQSAALNPNPFAKGGGKAIANMLAFPNAAAHSLSQAKNVQLGGPRRQ
jgi:hypothetical protein